MREYGKADRHGKHGFNRIFQIALSSDKLYSELATNKRLDATVASKKLLTSDMRKKRCKFRKNARRRTRRRIHRNQRRIEDLRRDAHYKVAGDLCSAYDHLLAPTFETSQMVQRLGRRINTDTVRKMLHRSHYEFRQRLKHVALKRGTVVHDVSEAYTSKSCGGCGRLHHKLGGNTVFVCSVCGYRAARDAHGARNIMVTNVESAVGKVGDAVRE